MASSDRGFDGNRFLHPPGDTLHCPICLNVLNDAVMCQRNEHCFCRGCITEHLENSHTCPTCREELSPETLVLPQRMVRETLADLEIQCNYSSRGCQRYARLRELSTHVNECGFAPVVCSNEGCGLELNRRDRAHHESEVCEFRRSLCHDCGEMKIEIEEIKRRLERAGIGEVGLREIAENVGDMEEELRDVQGSMADMKEELMQEVQQVQESIGTMEDQLQQVQGAVGDIKEQLTSFKKSQDETLPGNQGRIVEGVGKRVIVAGGYGDAPKSVEMFKFSTMSWIALQDMNQKRYSASSVIYNDNIIVSGGWCDGGRTNGMASLSIGAGNLRNEAWSDFPARLPSKLECHRSVVYKDSLIVIGGEDEDGKLSNHIDEVNLVAPYTNRQLKRITPARCDHGVEIFGDRVLICGGRTSNHYSSGIDIVQLYDILNNSLKAMPSLPYAVRDMATVRWAENIVVIGGAGKNGKALKSVVIYNVNTGKHYFLPDMNYARAACAAVVVDKCIMVMGGWGEDGTRLNSVEMFSFDTYSWENLRPMQKERSEFVAEAF